MRAADVEVGQQAAAAGAYAVNKAGKSSIEAEHYILMIDLLTRMMAEQACARVPGEGLQKFQRQGDDSNPCKGLS